MTSTEIAKEEWDRFLDAFSHRHQGWLVQIEPKLSGESDGARALPLEAVTRQLNSDAEELSVLVQREGVHGHVLRTIANPSRLLVQERNNGAEKTLVVECAGEGSTTVRLQRVIRPPHEEVAQPKS